MPRVYLTFRCTRLFAVFLGGCSGLFSSLSGSLWLHYFGSAELGKITAVVSAGMILRYAPVGSLCTSRSRYMSHEPQMFFYSLSSCLHCAGKTEGCMSFSFIVKTELLVFRRISLCVAIWCTNI